MIINNFQDLINELDLEHGYTETTLKTKLNNKFPSVQEIKFRDQSTNVLKKVTITSQIVNLTIRDLV